MINTVLNTINTIKANIANEDEVRKNLVIKGVDHMEEAIANNKDGLCSDDGVNYYIAFEHEFEIFALFERLANEEDLRKEMESRGYLDPSFTNDVFTFKVA